MSVRCVTSTQHRHSGLYACALVVRFLCRDKYHPTHTQGLQVLETWLMLAPKVFIIIVIAVITSYYDHFYNFQQTCIASSPFRSFRNKGREVDSHWLDLLVCVCVRVRACVLTHMCPCSCVCLKRPKVCSGVAPQELFTFVFESVSLTGLELTDSARLAGQQAPESSSLPLPSARIS